MSLAILLIVIGIVLAILVHYALGIVVILIGLALLIVPRLGAGTRRVEPRPISAWPLALRGERLAAMTPWKLPLIVAALAVPIVAAFYIGGGGVGVAAGALTAVALVVYAANQRPRGPIVPAPTADRRRHVLIVATRPVEEPADVAEIARAGGLDPEVDTDVLVLAPARIRFLDRWASDVEPARRAAQRNLVATVAALAKAGVEAEARVGDEDVVQAVEDQLQTYPATDVVLVSGAEGEEADGPAVEELESRLEAGFHRVVIES